MDANDKILQTAIEYATLVGHKILRIKFTRPHVRGHDSDDNCDVILKCVAKWKYLILGVFDACFHFKFNSKYKRNCPKMCLLSVRQIKFNGFTRILSFSSFGTAFRLVIRHSQSGNRNSSGLLSLTKDYYKCMFAICCNFKGLKKINKWDSTNSGIRLDELN